jgi:GNAT superfamily N-acetyltransferase
VTELPVLGRGALAAVAALCRRSLPDAPTPDELDGALFAPDQPAVVRGDPAVGVVATVETDAGAHVRLIVVDPTERGRGHGHALLESAEATARAAGHRSLTVGADPPYFLWPGAPSTATALLCLLERRHYARVDTNFDMTVDLGAIPDDPGGHGLATPGDRLEVDVWMATHWPNWRPEVLRALDKGNLVLARDDGQSHDGHGGDIVAFCAFEVNRTGLLGPVAVRPDLMGRGRGRSVLLGALHELRRRGRGHVAVVWVGPVVPYASVGGLVSSVYFVYHRELG